MARPVSGIESLEQAKNLRASAKTARELRQALAVIMPLEYGLTIGQTASVIGVSKRCVSSIRIQFINSSDENAEKNKKTSHGGRRNANMSIEDEKAFLAPYFEKAKNGGIIIVNEIKQALDECLGRKTALASVYNLLHRHGWRKIAPDKRHLKTDIEAQDEWKKNSRKR